MIYESPIRHFKVQKVQGARPFSPIEAHNERTKEQYASNPDIDTSRSRYNLHLVQPQGRYREEADRMIAAAHCRVRKDSVRVVEALVTASPEFFQRQDQPGDQGVLCVRPEIWRADSARIPFSLPLSTWTRKRPTCTSALCH